MRLIMVGTGPFAAPTFRILYQTPHTVLALVTSPLRPHHGKGPPVASLLRGIAEEHQTAVFDPEDINSAESRERLATWQADLLVVCDYGQILSATTLATARLGGINLHGSLLPKYRGAAPINWAIYHGEQEAGVTVIHMTPRVDAGPCVAQARLPIGPDETAGELEPRLAEAGAWLVLRTLDALEAGRLEALPQDPALACRAPRLKKTDGWIDWSRPAEALRNQIRAFEPWPKSFTTWQRAEGDSLRLILGPAKVVPQERPAPPGTVLEAGPRLVVAAGKNALALESVQPAGKRLLTAAEFLRGYPVRAGHRLG